MTRGPNDKAISFLERELDWLRELLEQKKIDLNSNKASSLINAPALPVQAGDLYADLLVRLGLDTDERLVLILALLPHVSPFLIEAPEKQPREFGGIAGKNQRIFIPSGETAMFILAHDDLPRRKALLKLFDRDHLFYKDHLVSLEPASPGDPELSGALTASADLIDLILRGSVRKPDLRPDFPAKLLSTDMSWDDIVLPSGTLNQLSDIEIWLQHHPSLINDKNMGRKLKPGFKALFYGPPGTGKTLSACLIGKKTGRDVYRIDLSTIVSKYIGETEKNLARLFDRAERKDWILFFDEADALFGKRTAVNDSHDRYANQEVSYLLQRIEYHEGLVILASNMKNNIDPAFLRRFQSIIYFPAPKAEERLQLWQKAFSAAVPVHSDVPLADLARRYELSGSLILNIVSYSTLKAIHEKSPVVTGHMLLEGISRELAKEGRTA